MPAAPLILTTEVIGELHALRDRAAGFPVDVPRLMETITTAAGKEAHMAQMTSQTVCIPGPCPYLVTYSIEAGHPAGSCRHMSMSLDRPERLPHPVAIEVIAAEMGFSGGIKDWKVWREWLNGHGVAVNVVQPVSGQWPG